VSSEFSIQSLLSTHDDNTRKKKQQLQQQQQQQQQQHQQQRDQYLESKDSGFEDEDEPRVLESEIERLKQQKLVNSHRISDLMRSTRDLMSSLQDVKKPNSDSSFPVNASSVDHVLTEDYLKTIRLINPNSSEFKRRFERSVLSALRDPQIQYLLTLYNFVDENLLKSTLLKFLKGSCLDTDTLHAAEKYLEKGNTPLLPTNTTSRSDSTPLTTTNFPKTDALFAFLSQSKNQNKQSSPSSISSEPAISEYHLPGSSNDSNMTDDVFVCTDVSNDGDSVNYKPQRNASCSEIQCEYCQKTFSNHHSLSRHLRTHEGKRTHKCSQCSRSFYDQSSYLRHVRSHNGDKKHKCEQCSMAFNKRSALEVHKRTHTGERPFVCKYCGKGFSISGNLHRHVLIHTGHRPYKCGKCPRAFNNPSHLARHINSFHT